MLVSNVVSALARQLNLTAMLSSSPDDEESNSGPDRYILLTKCVLLTLSKDP